jgi:hypothetical protein
MTKKKKILIGAGVAAVAVVGIAGGLFVGKKLYDRHKANKAFGGKKIPGSSREVVDDGPESPYLAPFKVAHPKTFRETIRVPDAVALGLSYDADTGIVANLLAGAFDYQGKNLGFIQGGGQLTTLFNGSIVHTGDSQAESLGDHENIVIDLKGIPEHCTSIVFGSYLVTPPSRGAPKAYIHMLPMLRQENIASQEASGGTRSIDYESSDEEEFSQGGTRGIGADDEDEDDESLVRLYMDELDNTGFGSQRGFVGGKLLRGQDGLWYFTPFRLAINAEPQFGLWPALEHYGKPQ